MRIRVLWPLLLCLILAAVAVVVPALEATSRDRTQQLVLSRSASLDRIAALAVVAFENDSMDLLKQHAIRYFELYGESVVVVDAANTPVLVVGEVDIKDPDLVGLADQATKNLPLRNIPTVRPWSSRYHYVARPINGAGDATGAVVVRVDAEAARSDVRTQWLLILAGAFLVVMILIAFALALTRWVLRPVRRLDEAANSLAQGERPHDTMLSGPPELRRLAGSFDSMATTVTSTLEQQRRLVADSSHQLRNPLAAIRLRIDSLEDQLDKASAQASTLAEVDADLDRLEGIVDRLLVLAEAEHRASSRTSIRQSGTTLDTTEVFVAEIIGHWAPTAEAAGCTLVSTGAEHLAVSCAPADVHDIIDALIDNAIKYAGRGSTITVAARRRTDRPGQVSIVVSDTGAGLGEDEISQAGQRFWRSAKHLDERGSGLGLAIVSQLVRANRGELVIGSNSPHGLAVTIYLGDGHV